MVFRDGMPGTWFSIVEKLLACLGLAMLDLHQRADRRGLVSAGAAPRSGPRGLPN